MVGARLIGWLGWAGLDSVLRLALLTGSTAIFSRLLDVRDFGTSAVVLIVIVVASGIAGTPFEEALAQRPALRKRHVETAWATALFLAGVLFLLSFPAGYFVAAMLSAPEVSYLMPAAAGSLFFSAYMDILRGLERRRRRFKELAIASVFGHLIGIVLAIAIALGGLGVWALIAQRTAVVIVQAIIMAARAGFVIVPRFSMQHLRDVRRYAGFQLIDRLADNLNYLILNYVTAALYGLWVLGVVNMALRFVEPLRGATLSNVHNLLFYYFSSTNSEGGGVANSAIDIIRRSSLAGAPVFIGLAAVSPLLLPILAGPGWDDAIGVAACLAIGTAILLPSRLVFTMISTTGRPEFGMIANFLSALTTLTALIVSMGLGPIGIGLARLAGDAAQACYALSLSQRTVGWSRYERLAAMLPGWLLSAGMGVLVFGFITTVPEIDDRMALALAIILGVACYAFATCLFAKSFARDVMAALPASSKIRGFA